jgi:heme A synthase
MQQVYRVFAYLIAAGVAVQAAAIAYGVFGLIKWVERGGTLDQSVEPGPELGGYVGFLTHLTAGIFVIPLIALLFLIFSFFAKIPGGIKWALIVFGLTVLQVALGLFAHEFAGLAAWPQCLDLVRCSGHGRHAGQEGGCRQGRSGREGGADGNGSRLLSRLLDR